MNVVGLVATNSPDYVVQFLRNLAAGTVVVPLRSDTDEYRVSACSIEKIIEPESGHGWLEVQATFEHSDEVAQIAFTSGTEGEPKGVLLTHANLASTVDRIRSIMRIDSSIREYVGVPVYLSGMARGLLGAGHRLQLRHRRQEALREADLVILAGVPCDFRLDYGRLFGRGAKLISANRSRSALAKNRKADLGLLGAPELFLRALARTFEEPRLEWRPWLETLRARDEEREGSIAEQAGERTEGGLNPLRVCRALEAALGDDSVIVADGGDFVGTASYVLRPRRPLSWLDPGPFGTLGVGAGFALAAKLVRPSADVWVVYGDGSVGFSLAEADTFARHGLGVIAVVGNDAAWTQIARDQVDILRDDVGTVLAATDYDRAAEGLGARGLRLDDDAGLESVLGEALRIARDGRPVYVNALLGRTDFRKGSLSI